MTRINVLAPKYLTDQHLMAEYRELPMVAASLRRSLNSRNGLPRIPTAYTLNKGHVTFFYNKGMYLYKRYDLLKEELVRRGYRLDPERAADFNVFTSRPGLNNDWTPSDRDEQINIERLRERILSKPEWYRYNGRRIQSLWYTA